MTSLAEKCFIYSLTLLYSSMFCVWLLIYAISHPGKTFWRYKRRSTPPKCLQDPVYGIHNYAKVNNVNIHYVEKGNRDKPLMLFVHGFPEFWFSWRHQISEFSKDYWVVALDLRGYGDSDRPSEQSAYKVKNILEDIRQLVRHLGKEQFILVAHDWGGVLAWNFLDIHPEMVSRYIIMGAPHCRTWKHVMQSNTKQFFMAWYTFFFQMPVLPELLLRMNDFGTFDDVAVVSPNENQLDIKEAYKYMFSRPGAMKSAVDYYRANCGEMLQTEEAPKSLPVGLFLFGDRDDYLVTDYLDTAKEQIPNLQTILFKDCNHFLQQSHAELVNTAMRNFLNKSEMVNGVKDK